MKSRVMLIVMLLASVVIAPRLSSTSYSAPAAAGPVDGATGTQDPGRQSVDSRRDCIEAATAKVRPLMDAGRSKQEIDRAFQVALAACSGSKVSPAEAALAGSANVEYSRLARLLVSQGITPAQYLQLVRALTRKLRAARRDPGFAQAYAEGDDDGDFVPNDRDRCPRSPATAPTDQNGCPTKERLPSAPAASDVRRALNAMKIGASPDCKNAPAPGSPEPLKIGYDNVNRRTFAMAVTKVRNQPADCTVFYEVIINLSGGFANLPEKASAHLIFRDTDNTDKAPSGERRQVFRIRQTDPDTGNRRFLFENGHRYNLVEWRVRAINGNGQSSKWSGWKAGDGPSFGEP
ncbi:MAG: hypothetical protein ACLGJB_25240 [Blastocatellia bacterium]